MELSLEISPSEKKISEKIGIENWKELSQSTIKNKLYACDGCGYVPKGDQKLRVHILPFPEEKFDFSDKFMDIKTSLLCDACHTLKHFDIAADNEFLRLVNSDFTQKDLIAICRHGNRALNAYMNGNSKIEKRIFLLKKNPKAYLKEITEDKTKYNSKIKVVFTNKFNWVNCR